MGELLKLVGGTFIAGIIVGFAADRIIIGMNKKKRDRAEKTLIHTFGPLTTNTAFSFDEVMSWITARDELMKNGCDAFVLKANNDTLKLINQRFDINFGVAKFLIIAIMKDKKIQDSLLIKYETLDRRLEQELAPGNGMLVIEGNK